MEIQARYLIVALFAILTYLSPASSGTASGQDANRVIIRATVAQSRPGRVAARVKVSKSRVRVGEWVMVNLDPPAGVTRPLFRVNFGDGREEVTSDRQIDHKYGRVGHYDITAWVEHEAPRPPPKPPAVPRVFLAVAPNPVPVGRRVTFNAQLAGNYPGIKYRFVFGDNEQTAWQDQAQTSHAYQVGNNYRAYVEIGAEVNGSFRSIGGARESVQVNAQPRDSVNLTAYPTTVEVGRRVIFSARAISRDPNISYRFVFGDGSATEWQTSSQAARDYALPNTYQAYVQMSSSSGASGGPIISSDRLPIRVITPQRVSVDLAVDPTTANTETLVTLTARVRSRATNVRYRFFYGDGSSSDWQVGRRSSHRYAVANTYFPYVEAGLLNNNRGITVGATSKTIQVAVTPFVPPTPRPSPTPTPAGSPSPWPSGSPTPSPGGSPSPSPGGSPTPSPDGSPTPSPGGSPTSSPGGSPTSSPIPPRAITDPTPPPGDRDPRDPIGTDWWKYLLVALLISFLAYRAYRMLFAPRPTFRSVPDAGGSGVDEATNPLAINSQILLSPDIEDGLYRVNATEPNLVRSIRSEND